MEISEPNLPHTVSLQQPNPQEPIPSQNNQNSKLLLALGILGLLLIAAVGGYYVGLMQGKTSDSGSAQVSELTPTPTTTQVVVDEPSPTPTMQKTYVNSAFNYSFSYPNDWKVTTDNYVQAADATTEQVFIFNPDDLPAERMFSGIIIQKVGMKMDLNTMERVTVNNIPMYMSDTPHGEEYYVNIPDADQFLYITGTGGYTSNEETNKVVREIFATFQFTGAN